MSSDSWVGQLVDIDRVDFAKTDGLIPAVVQDADSLGVLMLGWMDREALQATRRSGRVTFYSRSRQTQWVKGETSGNTLTLVGLRLDCDADTVLVTARPTGPTCHTGATSCFEQPREANNPAVGAGQVESTGDADFSLAPASEIGLLARTILERHQQRPPGSYTTRLFEGGTRRIAQKVGEEGVETALAAVVQGDDEVLAESADLLYHLVVLLTDRGLSLAEVEAVLRSRRS